VTQYQAHGDDNHMGVGWPRKKEHSAYKQSITLVDIFQTRALVWMETRRKSSPITRQLRGVGGANRRYEGRRDSSGASRPVSLMIKLVAAMFCEGSEDCMVGVGG
jgi:hypothetical protein